MQLLTTVTTPNRVPLTRPVLTLPTQGRYVVLAAEPLALVGVDVAAPRSARPGPAAARPLDQHLRIFRPQLADSEVGLERKVGIQWL